VVSVKDANGRYGLVNRQFERLFGVTRREVLGKTDEQLLGPEMAAKLSAHDREVLQAGAVREFDMQAPLGDEPHTFLTVKFPLRQPTGEIYAVCGISTDITERKHAEEALRERALQQAAVAELGRKALSKGELNDLMDEAVVLAARTLRVEFSEVFELQSGAQRLLMRAGVGWAEGHVGRSAVPSGSGSQAGYTLTVGEPVIVEDYATETRFERTPLAQGSGVRSGMTVLIAGRPRPFGVLGVHTREARHFTSDDAHFLQAIANVLAAAIERDHSDRSLSLAQRLEAVGSLAGGVAHDFNNLLTVISGSSDFALACLPADSEARADIEEIARAATRAAALTRQLLAFSRRQVLQPAVLDVNQVVEEMGSMLRRLIRADIELTLALGPGQHMVKADPGQLEQVIVNLVVNARDAMPQGGKLRLETGMVELDELYAGQHIASRPGRYVLIAVTDTGMGMDRQTQERIFEPFFTTKGDRGTGLGLATVYGIVKQSGGSIWVYSELEHGTTFKVYLPAVMEAASSRSRELTPAAGGSETVLLVEDDDAVRQLSARMLKSAGYHVLTANSGQEALNVVAGHAGAVDLLVTDLVMPNMRGSDLAERLIGGHPALRLLFMSGYTDPAFLEHKLIERGAPFLQKPFSAEALVRKVREVLTQPSPPSVA
jgi:PAS domain S-box-containing protein